MFSALVLALSSLMDGNASTEGPYEVRLPDLVRSFYDASVEITKTWPIITGIPVRSLLFISLCMFSTIACSSGTLC